MIFVNWIGESDWVQHQDIDLSPPLILQSDSYIHRYSIDDGVPLEVVQILREIRRSRIWVLCSRHQDMCGRSNH